VHAPGRQHSVDIFEEETVLEQRADRLVCSPPFDRPQVEVQARPGERLTRLEHRNAFGEFRCELLNPFSRPLPWGPPETRLFRWLPGYVLMGPEVT